MLRNVAQKRPPRSGEDRSAPTVGALEPTILPRRIIYGSRLRVDGALVWRLQRPDRPDRVDIVGSGEVVVPSVYGMSLLTCVVRGGYIL